MKYSSILFIIVTAITTCAIAGSPSPAVNLHVNYSAEIRQKNIRPGSKAEIVIKLQPEKGIHINLEPPISLTIDTTSAIAVKGKLEIPRKDKFLDVAKPLKQSFTLSRTVKPGTQTIKGTLTYYYCSDAEGWCSKFKQPVELTFNVVQ